MIPKSFDAIYSFTFIVLCHQLHCFFYEFRPILSHVETRGMKDWESCGLFKKHLFGHSTGKQVHRPFSHGSHFPLTACEWGSSESRIITSLLTEWMSLRGWTFHNRSWYYHLSAIDHIFFLIDQQLKRQWTAKIQMDIGPYLEVKQHIR